jgi:hypothetical protein
MKTYLKSIILFLLFPLLNISAQPAPIEFGDIDKSLLEMKVYDKDTTADAIVVCDYGSLKVYNFQFSRTVRYKILKKSGCDFANFAFPVSSKASIRGITYNLVNGKIVKTKLKSESIFEEDIDHRYFRYKVAMPNVQVGSVIDIHYYFQGIPSQWYFQRSIPVVCSELRLESSLEVGIQKMFFGMQPFALVEDGRWVCKDVPALKEEPYMNNLNNYLTKFEMEISYLNLPGYFSNYATSWDAVNIFLLDKSTFGEQLKTKLFMSDEAKAINDTCKTNKDKLIAAYETIKKRIKWNEQEELYPPYNTSIKSILKKGSGNAGDVNTALLLLLRKLDIEAYPVALSTRNNGLLSRLLPSIDKLNYIIVLAKIDGQDILLDATEEHLPLGMLPERAINGQGRLVNDKTGNWIDLISGAADIKRQTANIIMSNNGSITGELTSNFSDYGAYLFRKEYLELNDKNDYQKKIERDYPGLKINQLNISSIDSIYKPVTLNQTFEYDGISDMTDSTITFIPIAFDRLVTNPFKLDKRKIPIDFKNPFDYSYVFNYQIPSGYKLQEIPKSARLVMPNNVGKYVYRIASTDTTVMVYYNFSINKTIFALEDCESVKQWYADIIKKEAEPIVLKKK